jgi:putative protein-disulfide isomerase
MTATSSVLRKGRQVTELVIPEAEVLYITDAYCGWCYGFGPTLHTFYEGNRHRVPFRVISGGMFVGELRLPIRSYGHLEEVNARIAQRMGVTFGDPYKALLREGSFVQDSEVAAVGLAALRDQAPELAIEFIGTMQRAFYSDGLNLSDAETYKMIARDYGLDSERVVSFFTGPEGVAAARKDFSLARELGVFSYPTLVVCRGEIVSRLPSVGNSPETLTRRLDVALDAV